MKTQTDLDRLLEKLGACDDAREWARGYPDLQTAWDACKRPDWMLWLVAKLDKGYSPRLRLVVCAIARTALKYVPAGEERPRLAIECAERYARDGATDSELDSAWDAAWAAARSAAWDAAGDAASDSAGAAAWAAARTAARAAEAAEAAARAAAWAAGDAGAAAWAAARAAAKADQCRIIRERIPNPMEWLAP